MTFVHNINPVLLDVGIFEIRWYGLMYVLAFLFVYWYCRRCIKQGKLKLTESEFDWLLLWMVVGLLVCARLFHVFVWNWSYFSQNLAQIPMFWLGGLSFHGGLIGLVLALLIFCKVKDKPILNKFDIFIVPLALGQAFGRIGNFVNGELYGRITDVAWGVQFPGAEGFRHPSQLYAVFYNIVIFAILWKLKDKKMPIGALFGIWLVLYAVFRFVNEFFKEPETMIGLLTLGQFLNLFMIAGAIGLFVYLKKKYK